MECCLALMVEPCYFFARSDSAYRQGVKVQLLPKKRKKTQKGHWLFFTRTPHASQQLSFYSYE